jgi:hypothetical protein
MCKLPVILWPSPLVDLDLQFNSFALILSLGIFSFVLFVAAAVGTGVPHSDSSTSTHDAIFCCIQLITRCPAVLLMTSSFASIELWPFRLSTLLFFISRVHCPFTITNIFPLSSWYLFVLLHYGWRLCLFFARHYRLFGFIFLLVLRQ